MKQKIFILTVVALLAFSTGCSSFNKAKEKMKGLNTGDVAKIADLINMDFGKGPDGPFKVSKTTSYKPELVIDNQTDRTIRVVTSGSTARTIIVNSKKKQTVSVNPGDHHFVATAKGTRGCNGDVKLKGFNRYTWIFYIK